MENTDYLNKNTTIGNCRGQGVVESAIIIALFTTFISLGFKYFKGSQVEIERSQWNSSTPSFKR